MKTKIEIGINLEELPDLSTDKELQQFTRKSAVTHYRLREKGILPFRRIGGQIMYTKSDVQEFLNRCKRNAGRS